MAVSLPRRDSHHHAAGDDIAIAIADSEPAISSLKDGTNNNYVRDSHHQAAVDDIAIADSEPAISSLNDGTNNNYVSTCEQRKRMPDCWRKFKWSVVVTLALVQFLLSFLPWPDMVTDGMSIHNWKRLCSEDKLECFWWPLGVTFWLLPTIVMTVLFCCWKDAEWWQKLLAGPTFVVWAPVLAIYVKGKNLVRAWKTGSTATDEATDDGELTDEDAAGVFLICEALLEALPQSIIQWYLLTTKKDVLYNNPEYFWKSYEFAVTSAVISSLMLVWKLVMEPIKTRCYNLLR